MTKYKPIHEHQDGRGTSVRYANQTIKRRKARRIAEKMMGKGMAPEKVAERLRVTSFAFRVVQALWEAKRQASLLLEVVFP